MGWGNVSQRIAAAALACGLLAACGPLPAKPPIVYTDNWAELCAQKDCDQFPVGYVTTQVGAYSFYEPVFYAGNSYLPDDTGYYVQLNADGSMRRSVKLIPEGAPFRVGHPCCDRLVERFNLPPPQIAGYIGNSGFWFYDTRRYGPGIQNIRRKHVQFNSLAELEALDLPVFDDNFWLVEEGALNEGPHLIRNSRDYLLISRRPLIFGRHVWADCSAFCEINTIEFKDDPRPDLPQVRVRSMTDNRLRGDRYCNEEGQPCIPTRTPYEAIPAGLEWVEKLLKALQRKPADA